MKANPLNSKDFMVVMIKRRQGYLNVYVKDSVKPVHSNSPVGSLITHLHSSQLDSSSVMYLNGSQISDDVV